MASIALIDPKCDPSFWRFDHALPMFHKRATMPSAALPLVAALTPSQHQGSLVDENVEPIDFERLANSDIVALTGISVQRYRMVEILKELKRRAASQWWAGPGSASKRIISGNWRTSFSWARPKNPGPGS